MTATKRIRYYVLLPMLAIAFGAVASSPEKEFKKIVEDCDVPVEVKALTDVTAADFWITALNNDEQLLKFESKLARGKGSEGKTLQVLGEQPRFHANYCDYVVRTMEPLCDTILTDLGMDVAGVKAELHLVDTPDPIPFTALTDSGFAICFPTALYDRPGLTDDMMVALVAKEYAHGVLLHRAREINRLVKQEHRDKVTCGVLSAVVIGTAVTAAVLGPDDGPDVSITNVQVNSNNVNVNEVPVANACPLILTYGFDYAPCQVYQADLWGYRFMDFLGRGNAYRQALEFLGSNGIDARVSENQPTIEQRVNFVEYAASHPELDNRRNAKLRQKRMRELAR